MRKSILIALPLIAVLLATVPCSADNSPQAIKKASKFYSKGERAFKTGNMKAAAEAFNEAIGASKDFPEAHIGLGHIAIRESRFEEALASYEKARDGYGALGEAMFKIRTQRYTGARDQVRDLRDQISNLQSNSSNAGLANLQVSKLENMISQLEVIEPPSRDNSSEPPGEVFFYIGNALFRLNRLAEAVTAWETCRDKSPEFAMVYNNLALAYMQTGKLGEASVSLAKAEELGFPVNPQFKADLAAATSGAN